jgi:peroxiredoxin
LADYRDHYNEIRKAGSRLVAVAVDSPNKSEALRQQLSLQFPILCDTERRLVREWGIYNPREKGGIAKPAVFLIDPDRVTRFAAVDSVSTRVSAPEMIRLLKISGKETYSAQPKRYIPRFSDWLRALHNVLRR